MIEATYDAWRKTAEENEAPLAKQGIDVVRVECDLLVMIDWCNQRGMAFDGAARSRYVAERLQRGSVFEK